MGAAAALIKYVENAHVNLIQNYIVNIIFKNIFCAQHTLKCTYVAIEDSCMIG
jgi:hypothetical protein